MNKSRLPLPVRTRKKVEKDVKSGVLHPEPIAVDNDIKKAPLLSSRADKLKKEIQKKQKKSLKRAAPAPEFSGPQAAPQSSHQEGKRWIKSLAQQTKAKNKISIRKEAKFKK